MMESMPRLGPHVDLYWLRPVSIILFPFSQSWFTNKGQSLKFKLAFCYPLGGEIMQIECRALRKSFYYQGESQPKDKAALEEDRPKRIREK